MPDDVQAFSIRARNKVRDTFHGQVTESFIFSVEENRLPGFGNTINAVIIGGDELPGGTAILEELPPLRMPDEIRINNRSDRVHADLHQKVMGHLRWSQGPAGYVS